MAKKKKYTDPKGVKTLADNRKAHHDYDIMDTLEAGLVLQGTEVKSLRSGGQGNIGDSYAVFTGGELWLLNAFISTYAHGNRFNHEERRTRKLLLHYKEMIKFSEEKERKGLTIIPLKLYFKKGKVKVLLGLAKGRKTHDKRHAIKDRDWQRQQQRLLRSKV